MSFTGIRPATMADSDPVCRLLHTQMNPRITVDRWRRLMTYGWLGRKPDLGRVAMVEGKLVGFLGMIYADRQVAGRSERVVNICAWYVDKDYRGRGLGADLMRQATADEGMSYAILNAAARTQKLLDANGYRILDEDRRIWSLGNPTGQGAVEITRHAARIVAQVTDTQTQMLRDHAGLSITPFLIGAEGKSCLAIFSIKKKGADVTYFDALHIADPPFFAQHAQAIANALLPRDIGAVLAADSRLLGGPADRERAGGEIERLPVPRYFKSNRLQPGEIDNMYSEVQLMDLKLD